METPLQKECVVNATLMAKLVRPAEGIPPGVTSTVGHNTHSRFTTSLPNKGDFCTEKTYIHDL